MRLQSNTVFYACSNGVSVLHCAVGNGHQAVVECLLEAHAKVNLQGSTTNRTPLFLAVDISSKNILKTLLKHRAKTNVTDSFGEGWHS